MVCVPNSQETPTRKNAHYNDKAKLLEESKYLEMEYLMTLMRRRSGPQSLVSVIQLPMISHHRVNPRKQNSMTFGTRSVKWSSASHIMTIVL